VSLTPFDLVAIFIALVAAVGWLNVRLLRIPSAVAMTLAGLLGAIVLSSARALGPADGPAARLTSALQSIDFSTTVLSYLLAFLLFAGAMQVDLAELRRRRLSVWSLATIGVLASTFLVGGGLWAVARALSLDLSLPWAFVFGALISPTDPIAVLAAVARGGFSKRLQVLLQGEALFNDGVGIVVFTAAVAVAAGGEHLQPLKAIGEVAVEAAGGLLIGLAIGMLVVRALRAVDDYAVEVTMTLALAIGVYAVAQAAHVSGPIAVVAAGLLVGNTGVETAMSETTQRYVEGFWRLVDEILNALIFLLLGLELAVIGVRFEYAALWGAAIVLVLAARLAVVVPWGAYYGRRFGDRGAAPILAWGGLHGALSLALALTLPHTGARDLVLSTTFSVVVFSIVVQGLTFPLVAARLQSIAP
jgi:CPA1 family monovalent cation:H+ antiporter